MTITRKQFLRTAASGSVLLLLQACGGSEYGDDPPPAPAQGCGASGATIAGNHGHVLLVPQADLDSIVDRTYNITGTANHPHTVTFTPAQLQTLKARQTVTVTSSTDSMHSHAMTASCV